MNHLKTIVMLLTGVLSIVGHAPYCAAQSTTSTSAGSVETPNDVQRFETASQQLQYAIDARDKAFQLRGEARYDGLSFAIQCFEQVVKLHPEDTKEVAIAKAQQASLMGLLGSSQKDVIRIYQQAATLANDPQEKANILSNMANFQAFRLQEYGEAIKTYQAAIAAAGENGEEAARISISLGMAYAAYARDMQQKAIRSYQNVIAKYPDDTSSVLKAYEYLIRTYMQWGQVDLAKKAFARMSASYGEKLKLEEGERRMERIKHILNPATTQATKHENDEDD